MWCKSVHRWVVAGAVGLALAPAAARADESPPAVTVTAPGGTLSLTVADVAHWVRVARADDPRARQRALERRTLAYLVPNLWIAGEAAERGIVLTDAQVQAEFAIERRQSFPKWSAFERFLRHSRMTLDDIHWRVRMDLLANRLRDQVTAPVSVSEADVDAAVRKAKPQVIPPTRDLRLVIARTRALADRARAALEAGAGWKTVARRYSIDPTTRGHGGLLRRRPRADLPRRFGRTVFHARRGVLVGPLRSGHQYVVFEVLRIRPGRTISPERQRAAIRDALVEKAQQAALEAFVTAFHAKWRARTTCASWFTWSDQCGNWDGTPASSYD